MKIEMTVLVYSGDECVNGWAGDAKSIDEALTKFKYVLDDFKKYKDVETFFSLFDDKLSLAYNGDLKKLKRLNVEYKKCISELGEEEAFAYMFNVYHWLIIDNLAYHDATSVEGYFIGTGKAVDDFCNCHCDEEHYYSSRILKRLK